MVHRHQPYDLGQDANYLVSYLSPSLKGVAMAINSSAKKVPIGVSTQQSGYSSGWIVGRVGTQHNGYWAE